jgi:hypothetical protein
MEVIFGTGCATGKFVMGSNEALGSLSDFTKSSLKHLEDDIGKLFEEVGKKQEGGGGGSGSVAGNKRKRSSLSDEDITIMTGMAAAVNNVADAIRETKAQDEHPDLYEAVMFMPGFSEEALIMVYSHLLDNRAQGGAFVKMNQSHRMLWLKTFLAKHYYPQVAYCQWLLLQLLVPSILMAGAFVGVRLVLSRCLPFRFALILPYLLLASFMG